MDRQIVIRNKDLEATIALRGAELLSLKKNNKEYIWIGDEKYWKAHAPILFPVCSGLIDEEYSINGKDYPMTKHGFIRFKDFNILSSGTDYAIFSFLGNEETRKSFPFKFQIIVKYILTDKLEIDYKIINLGTDSMYFSIGSHEGYLLDDDFENYYIEFEKDEALMSNEVVGSLLSHKLKDFSSFNNHLPLRYDDYKVDALVFQNVNSRKLSLMHVNKGKILTVEYPHASNIVTWTKIGAKYICIEPWTAVGDYIDSPKDITKKDNIIKLESSKSYHFYHSIKVD